MTRETVMARVKEFVVDNFLYTRPDFELGATDSLMGHGIVDSMGVLDVMLLLAEEFGVVVPDEDITEENLGTLAAIGDYVMRRREERARQTA